MAKGYLAIVLHAHLPFVRHPEHEDFLEERWLFEAITETYIPLLRIFEKLVADRVPFRVTMSVTPTLVAMLRDGLLQERYLRHMNQLIELAGREVERLRWDPRTQRLALDYHWRFTEARTPSRTGTAGISRGASRVSKMPECSSSSRAPAPTPSCRS